MPETKCAECTEGAVLCEKHANLATGDLDIRPAYMAGLILWAGTWIAIFVGIELGWFSQKLLVNDDDKWFFLVPVAFGVFFFSMNLWMWGSNGKHGNYAEEVAAINRIELNSSWFLIAGGTLLGGGSFFFTNLTSATERGPFVTAFITFVGLSILTILPSILKYWTPYGDAKKLAIIRHVKTLPFGFAAGFLAAAVVALLLAVQTV